MGVYHMMVCHDCRRVYTPESLKAREILMNPESAELIGYFCAQHAGHRLELVPDGPVGDGSDRWDILVGYEPQDPADDEDVQWARKMRGA